VIRGTISQKKFKKIIHQYSNKTEVKSLFLFIPLTPLKVFHMFSAEMEENDCKNARLRRKFVLQQRLNARSNQHSGNFLTYTLNHLTTQSVHQTFIYKFCISMFISSLQITKNRMQKKNQKSPTILLKV